MNTLELAQLADVERCYQIIDAGREFQKKQGFVQWTDEYPNLDTIQRDIEQQKGYVMKVDGTIAGYLYLDFDGEPDYATIQGKWRTEEPYAVVHRMAFSDVFRGMGLACLSFQMIEALCKQRGVSNIRVDTDFANERMRHILKKSGYELCGVITFQGYGKLAFDKLL